MERFSVIIFLAISFLSCFLKKEQNIESKIESYKKNVDQYTDTLGCPLDKERKEIEQCLHIPQRNYKLEVKVERVARFNYSIEGLIYGPEKPNIRNPLSFNTLLLVDVEGNMYFSEASYGGENADTVESTPKKYLKKENKIIELEDRELESIFKYDDVFYPEKVFNSIPWLLFGCVDNIYYTEVCLRYLGESMRNIMLMKIKNKTTSKRILLYTYFFLPFGAYWHLRKSLDSKNRIYLGLWNWDRENYRKVDRFQILVYDFEKDTMYFIEWPKPSAGKETIIQVSYVIGDDDVIYVQVVADKACSIYRITPLWDEPMEPIEYRPMFYEFYPEIEEKERQAIRSK